MQYLLKDGRIVGSNVIVDFDSTHTNAVSRLTTEEYAQFVASSIAEPLSVPQTVTPRQARLALLQVGLLDQVTSMISISDKSIQITWEFATEINRNDILIQTLGSALKLTSDQIDDLFRKAATL